MSQPRFSDMEIELGHTLTEIVAPEEAPYFNDIVAASTAPAKKKRGDHELGFGIPADDIGTVSAAILVLSKPILDFIWDNVRDAAGQLIKDATDHVRVAFERRLSEWIKHRFAKPLGAQLSPEKIGSLVEMIKKDAAAAGLDQSTTKKLVAAMQSAVK